MNQESDFVQVFVKRTLRNGNLAVFTVTSGPRDGA